jgi:hypothetical protein
VLYREGATIWFIKQLIKARATRFTYGLQINAIYDHRIHHQRYKEAFVDIE